MPSFEHQRLRETIIAINTPPENLSSYDNWIRAKSHLAFIKKNFKESELLVFGYHDCRFIEHDRTYIDSFIIDESILQELNASALRSLSKSPHPLPCNSSSIYIKDGDSAAIRSGLNVNVNKSFREAKSLVFNQIRKISVNKEERYLEILQDYIHLSETHWWQDQSAYCRIDDNGDLESVVSITCDESEDHIVLASFKREPLEQYLAVTNSVLVRLFAFELYDDVTIEAIRNDRLSSDQESKDIFGDNIFYHQKIIPRHMGKTIGVQIMRPSRSKEDCIESLFRGERDRNEYIEFLGWDFRNDPNVKMISDFPGELVATDLSDYPGASIPITMISTDPNATTHYYAAKGNRLPFDTSPIFFRPEILLKYNGDHDKYSVESGRVTCRAGWDISYDFNKAGQVHTNIRRLKRLPYSEQLYWKSFNEAPKAEMSERAFHHWFKAEGFPGTEPLTDVVRVLSRWHEKDVAWWKIRDDNLMARDFSPRTSSREEWARAFMDLSNLVTDGFRTKVIRTKLRESKVDFQDDDRSLALLRRLRATQQNSDETSSLEGLREVQAIRNKVAAHVGRSKAEHLSHTALEKHGSYTAHFNHVCQIVTEELKIIEGLFS